MGSPMDTPEVEARPLPGQEAKQEARPGQAELFGHQRRDSERRDSERQQRRDSERKKDI